MDINKLVSLINAELKKDNSISVNNICNKLNLKQSTVKSQLRREGYSYNAEIRAYTKDIQRDNMEISEPLKEPKIKPIQIDNKDIDINSLRELISLIEPIRAIVEVYNKNDTIVEVNKAELKAKAVTEVKQKLFKIDVKVLEQWEEFVAEHKEYKVQQLISLALEEFINKYKKI